MRQRVFRLGLFIGVVGVASGCFGMRYLSQAAAGELSLLRDARPIQKVVDDERTPSRVRALLAEVPRIKRFGQFEGLKATASYRRYVSRPGNAVVWVVSACEALSFDCRSWSFPLMGNFPYLGWFDPDAAQKFGDELRREGLDVDVRGASAFSTLGWFSDPLISTMLPDDDGALGELVNVVLHESVHATLHVRSEAHFNESLATFVADRLTLLYLQFLGGGFQGDRVAYERNEARRAERERKIHSAYEMLKRIYASSLPDADKLARKQEILSALRADARLSRPPNNATLEQYRTYSTGFEDFQHLFNACGSSWPRFLAAVETLGRDAFAEQDQQDFTKVLAPLVAQHCSSG